MNVRLHVQFMSPEGAHDRIFGEAKAAVHDGVTQVVRDAVGADTDISVGYNNASSYITTRQFMPRLPLMLVSIPIADRVPTMESPVGMTFHAPA